MGCKLLCSSPAVNAFVDSCVEVGFLEGEEERKGGEAGQNESDAGHRFWSCPTVKKVRQMRAEVPAGSKSATGFASRLLYPSLSALLSRSCSRQVVVFDITRLRKLSQKFTGSLKETYLVHGGWRRRHLLVGSLPKLTTEASVLRLQRMASCLIFLYSRPCFPFVCCAHPTHMDALLALHVSHRISKA